MDRISVGCLVKNLNGRDRDCIFMVMAIEGDFVYLADGKHRFLNAPKRKKKKHISLIGICGDLKGISTDKGLRRFLKTVGPQQTI